MNNNEKDFRIMYYSLPDKAKYEMFVYYNGHPVSLRVIYQEVHFKTQMGKNILKMLGYKEK